MMFYGAKIMIRYLLFLTTSLLLAQQDDCAWIHQWGEMDESLRMYVEGAGMLYASWNHAGDRMQLVRLIREGQSQCAFYARVRPKHWNCIDLEVSENEDGVVLLQQQKHCTRRMSVTAWDRANQTVMGVCYTTEDGKRALKSYQKSFDKKGLRPQLRFDKKGLLIACGEEFCLYILPFFNKPLFCFGHPMNAKDYFFVGQKVTEASRVPEIIYAQIAHYRPVVAQVPGTYRYYMTYHYSFSEKDTCATQVLPPRCDDEDLRFVFNVQRHRFEASPMSHVLQVNRKPLPLLECTLVSPQARHLPLPVKIQLWGIFSDKGKSVLIDLFLKECEPALSRDIDFGRWSVERRVFNEGACWDVYLCDGRPELRYMLARDATIVLERERQKNSVIISLRGANAVQKGPVMRIGTTVGAYCSLKLVCEKLRLQIPQTIALDSARLLLSPLSFSKVGVEQPICAFQASKNATAQGVVYGMIVQEGVSNFLYMWGRLSTPSMVGANDMCVQFNLQSLPHTFLISSLSEKSFLINMGNSNAIVFEILNQNKVNISVRSPLGRRDMGGFFLYDQAVLRFSPQPLNGSESVCASDIALQYDGSDVRLSQEITVRSVGDLRVYGECTFLHSGSIFRVWDMAKNDAYASTCVVRVHTTGSEMFDFNFEGQARDMDGMAARKGLVYWDSVSKNIMLCGPDNAVSLILGDVARAPVYCASHASLGVVFALTNDEVIGFAPHKNHESFWVGEHLYACVVSMRSVTTASHGE